MISNASTSLHYVLHSKKKATKLALIHYNLDQGEAATITLALQEKEKEVLLDESISQQVATMHSLTPVWFLRVLLLAYNRKLVDEAEVQILLGKILAIGSRVGADVLFRFNELFEKMKGR